MTVSYLRKNARDAWNEDYDFFDNHIRMKHEEEIILDDAMDFLAEHNIELYDRFGFSAGDGFWVLEPDESISKLTLAFAAAAHEKKLSLMISTLSIPDYVIGMFYRPELMFGYEED